MLKLVIKVTEKDKDNSKVELIAPKKEDLEKAKETEKYTLNVVYNTISEGLQKLNETK
jgi:hypothetical protein